MTATSKGLKMWEMQLALLYSKDSSVSTECKALWGPGAA